MDAIDIKLIRLLGKNADVTATSLVPQLNLSVPAINKRIAKLKAEGIIQKTIILTDTKKVGKPITAYVLLVLKDFNLSDQLVKTVDKDPDILECYAITGEYDFILKVCADSIDAVEDKLLYLKKKGISKSHTLFALRQHKFDPCVLPDELG